MTHHRQLPHFLPLVALDVLVLELDVIRGQMPNLRVPDVRVLLPERFQDRVWRVPDRG